MSRWVDGAMRWSFELRCLTPSKPTLKPFDILLTSFPERDCKVFEALLGDKVVMKTILIKLMVPQKIPQ